MKNRYLFTLSDDAIDALDFCAESLSPNDKRSNRSATVEDAIFSKADQIHRKKAKKAKEQ